MMQKYFGKFAKELNIPFEELFSFGQTRLDPAEQFSMTILALRLSRHANGVSKLHGEVSSVALERCVVGRSNPRGAYYKHYERRAYKNVDGAGVCRAVP